ncbi:ParB/RepB/Spo0J family partition protein [Staphylococcus saccharolyticus]|uniref:Transcription terminator n=1 Tax=Staphylococcus saccharolyticus TaxID=33028 RepID=A0A380H8X4_9STAP|nr:ParB/RepB/Spo0J family partition protein [Staphylococcus saccharolyticus]MBL7564434.1 ParB/RepB/Spo0J family partition protein [Staphylococcus saccharolyticus]MBL7571302.1 ParB/RepB/Spo0J family partition protein [Staphylococcus saccharolyticus]QQB99134.1 ParB/RepB/Spo0J family partition protein [Staphylococcus saccharolyticus]QRJ66652.1 ParB/RepB/Spo0J family partition protein [Staphylococcus saccharolyticus]RTX94583.1 ParB/RepB/Spo0J family partition protein [Staphylococcus saccharolyticu
MTHADDQRLQLNNDESVQKISIELIKPNPYQPRKTFDEERLNDLAQSIKQHGILQPIVLRRTIQGYYIVVGERRFRASQIIGLNELPAIVKKLSDEDMMELAIIENLQREDLNVIEEADSYKKLMTDLNITQQEVAKRLGKSRPYIANMLRLLHLPKNISQMVQQGELSGAHGRTLLALKDETTMKKIAKQSSRESWSVRYLEQVVNQLTSQDAIKGNKQTKQSHKPKFIHQQERRLKERYGSKVEISTAKNIGKITFEFKSEAEFKRLIQQLNKNHND